jgi:hypothetical protein
VTDDGVVGVGVGLAPGFGELLAVLPPAPPHPIMVAAEIARKRKALIFVVKFVLLRTIKLLIRETSKH